MALVFWILNSSLDGHSEDQMSRKEQRCRAEEHYTRRFPKAVQMPHYSPRQPHARLSSSTRVKNLTVPWQEGGSGPLSTFSSQNLIHPTPVPSSSSIALQMWNGVLGCHAGCDKERTQSPFLGTSAGVPVAAAAATGLVSPFPTHLAVSLH